MSKGQLPDFRAFVSRPGEKGKSYYTEVGAAWHVKDGGISIKLRPNLAVIGEMVLFVRKDEENGSDETQNGQ